MSDNSKSMKKNIIETHQFWLKKIANDENWYDKLI